MLYSKIMVRRKLCAGTKIKLSAVGEDAGERSVRPNRWWAMKSRPRQWFGYYETWDMMLLLESDTVAR